MKQLFFTTSCLLLAGQSILAENESKNSGFGHVIGIDLGTTYSSVGVYINGKVEIIPNDQGNKITPSYVAFTAKGERLIGDTAKCQITANPENTVFDVKRLIGKKWYDETLQDDLKMLPFKVIEKNSKPYVKVATSTGHYRTFAPEEISAMVLRKMKETAEAYLGTNVTHAVVTVSASFNDAQRQATKDAGAIAGLNVLRTHNEPTAAAVAYGLDKKEGVETALVFNLGGGTVDVTLLSINNGVFEVTATHGDTHLGGEDFDQRVMYYFIKLYQETYGKDITKDKRAVQKLRREVEKAKRVLSFQNQTQIEIDSFFEGENFRETLTRAKFEELNMDLFSKIIVSVQKVLDDAGKNKTNVDEIVLVGGSTRIPKIQQLVKEFFDGKEPNTGIDPDNTVAYGAAVYGAVLSQEQDKNIVLLDVNPMSLGIGIEINAEAMEVLVPRNTRIPVRKFRSFTTGRDMQRMITFKVYEGESPFTRENNLLGMFSLTDIQPAKKGVPEIEVSFEIDANGILQVSAENLRTGKWNGITIANNHNRLHPADVTRMTKDAEKFADEDKNMKENVDARNEFESYVYSLKYRTLYKLGSKLSDDDQTKLRKAIDQSIRWLENNEDADLSDTKIQKKKLEAFVRRIFAQLY